MASRFISRSVLTLLAATALSTQGYAANPMGPEVSFHPTKPWQVGSAGGGACAIKNQFNNGFTVQFEGAKNETRALSIDFQQGIFKPGQTYDAMVTVPGGAAKKFPAKAVSARALAMNFEGSEDLVNSMRDSSVFDLGVEGNDFRFYLVGFAAATKSFEKCMAGETAPAAAPARAINNAAMTPPPALSAPSTKPAGSDITVNESIAFEEKENRALDGEAPPVVIAPAQTAVIDTTQSSEPVLEPVPYAEKTFLGGQKASSGRMSERLAKQITDNPAILGQDAPPVKVTNAAAKKPAQDFKDDFMTPPPNAAITPAPVTEEPLEDSLGALPLPEDEIKTGAKVATIAPPPAEMPEDAETKNADKKKGTIVFRQPRQEPKQAPRDVMSTTFKTNNPDSKESLSTPAVKVHKSTQRVEMDMTGLDDMEPAAQGEQPFSAPHPRKADPEMLRKISELESSLADLKKENATLNTELKSSLGDTHSENVSISTENWNLERATLAYNEAERQLKRLGQQLQQERAQCEMQKQDIEGQLFDPQVTSQQQLAKLADLEEQLGDAQRKLEDQRIRYEERIKAMEVAKASQ